jgi:membrane protein insertase Oxa1/YidC/SpoIIIJ
MNMLSQFGIDPIKFFVQLLISITIFLVPAIYASIQVVRSASRATTPIWMIFIWLFPIVGPAFTILSMHMSKKKVEQGAAANP